MTKQELRTLLMDCAEKLNLYRAQHSGEYIGGVEYTALQRRIVKALDDIRADEPTARCIDGGIHNVEHGYCTRCEQDVPWPDNK